MTPMPMYVTTDIGARSSNRVPEDAYLRDKNKVLFNSGCPGCSLCHGVTVTVNIPGIWMVLPRYDRSYGNDRRPLLNGELIPEDVERHHIRDAFILRLKEGDTLHWIRAATWVGPTEGPTE